MIVEFIGGSLGGQTKVIERFFEYINNSGEIYYAKILRYEKLGWLYVWYEYSGSYQIEMV